MRYLEPGRRRRGDRRTALWAIAALLAVIILIGLIATAI